SPVFLTIRRTDKKALNTIARQFSGLGPCNDDDRLVETLAFPPVGVFSRKVYRHFGSAGKCLAELVASHEQALAEQMPRCMEFPLLGVWLIMTETVSAQSPVQRRCQFCPLPQERGKVGWRRRG